MGGLGLSKGQREKKKKWVEQQVEWSKQEEGEPLRKMTRGEKSIEVEGFQRIWVVPSPALGGIVTCSLTLGVVISTENRGVFIGLKRIQIWAPKFEFSSVPEASGATACQWRCHRLSVAVPPPVSCDTDSVLGGATARLSGAGDLTSHWLGFSPAQTILLPNVIESGEYHQFCCYDPAFTALLSLLTRLLHLHCWTWHPYLQIVYCCLMLISALLFFMVWPLLSGYQNQPEHQAFFTQILQAPQDDVQTIIRDRFPVRFLLAKLNPSAHEVVPGGDGMFNFPAELLQQLIAAHLADLEICVEAVENLGHSNV
ncbi:hypothetical protein C4D60_Mb06t19810 [Musa balbisiana]|uniref:Uncharacterized protein n=1 Tax=Musa balbisiana TaxID=52838 RepID=A0A4S8IPZ6_MUSBA|nr:hypothetical protein C4D60_Mb06t19810 [Musa balbisiana]